MSVFTPFPGLESSLVSSIVSRGVVDVIEISDNNNLTGQLFRNLIGPSFDPFRTLPTMTSIGNSAGAVTLICTTSASRETLLASPIGVSRLANTAAGASIMLDNSIIRARIATSTILMPLVAAAAPAITHASTSTEIMNAFNGQVIARTSLIANPSALDILTGSSVARAAIAGHSEMLAAFTASDIAVVKFMAGALGGTPSAWTSSAPFAEDVPAMTAVSTSTDALHVLVRSSVSMAIMANSVNAMNILCASGVARNAIWDNVPAWDAVAASAMAIGKYVAANAGFAPSAWADINSLMASAASANTAILTPVAIVAIARSTVASNALFDFSHARATLFDNVGAWNNFMPSSAARSVMLARRTGVWGNATVFSSSVRLFLISVRGSTFGGWWANGAGIHLASTSNTLEVHVFLRSTGLTLTGSGNSGSTDAWAGYILV